MIDSVSVGPIRYDVVYDEAAIDKQGREDRDVLSGFTDLLKQRILIRPGMGADRTAEIVLHEVLHAAADLGHLFGEDGAAEEDAVRRLAPILLDIMRRNPVLVDYLQAG